MIRRLLFPVVLLACAMAANAQVAEVAISGGVSRFGGAELVPADQTLILAGIEQPITLSDGFRLAFRFTVNPYRFFGHEFGYAYNRSKSEIGGLEVSPLPIHQGFYAFVVHATPEGSRVRPFAAGGVNFSSFFPPGASVYYGNQITKFGINYGVGIKARLTDVWGIRVDFRQFNTGKPDLFQTPVGPSGRLRQNEISAGISFNM
jgi:opacity protein-like surface antigen